MTYRTVPVGRCNYCFANFPLNDQESLPGLCRDCAKTLDANTVKKLRNGNRCSICGGFLLQQGDLEALAQGAQMSDEPDVCLHCAAVQTASVNDVAQELLELMRRT